MLEKSLRLKLDADFSRVYRKGLRRHSRNFVVTQSDNTLMHPRFAVVVPKTVSKKATVRNLIRRRVHEVLKKALLTSTKLQESSLDILISAKKGSEVLDLAAISGELAPLLGDLQRKKPAEKHYDKKSR